MENLIIHISSGQGPEECCRTVFHVKNRLEIYLKNLKLEVQTIGLFKSVEKNSFHSTTISIKGMDLENILKEWVGTIQWIAASPFRPKHKRKNWFISISKFKPITIKNWNEKDFKFDTCRASGPGGQNVNKVESAVRAIHPATGISVQVAEKRTQLENKKIAQERLLDKLQKLNEQEIVQFQITQWNTNKQLERGNPIKVFNEPL
ncbi:peptide chain release factor H [Rhizosphaericola mali]|uniref:Peptide chain release factor H n=1 Tax=Rhizosphaericola mali TaxID=2545455 RepID=A0A5P2G1G8_9BACT|nr:peptide chain release factor H [Rhizosphaericola mali]QES87939.1 peptide chain release factor H [Rhizosphaericola mali]